MFLRILIVGLLIVGAMVAVKDGRVLRNAGLTGSCTSAGHFMIGGFQTAGLKT